MEILDSFTIYILAGVKLGLETYFPEKPEIKCSALKVQHDIWNLIYS